MSRVRLQAEKLRTHVWKGLESIDQALQDQRSAKVLNGLFRI